MVAVQTLEVVQGPQILYIVTLQQKAQVWTLHFCNIFVCLYFYLGKENLHNYHINNFRCHAKRLRCYQRTF
jgi:hypothetical protein